MTRAWTAVVALAALLAPLSGCTNIEFHGKVMPGEVGRALRVGDTDERMESDGVKGVKVTLSQGGAPGQTTASLGSAVSGPDGKFTISVANEKLRAGRILVTAEGESIFKLQNLVDAPREGEAVLVQVIQRIVPPSTGAGASTEKKTE